MKVIEVVKKAQKRLPPAAKWDFDSVLTETIRMGCSIYPANCVRWCLEELAGGASRLENHRKARPDLMLTLEEIRQKNMVYEKIHKVANRRRRASSRRSAR